MAISKELAALLGGRIGANSTLDKGSEFWFTARFERQSESVLPAPHFARADLRGVRVLIVDDNATNREILMTRLRAWGMRPAESNDGPAALDCLGRAAAEGDPFRLVLLDMQMPGMDGATLGRRIQSDPQLKPTRMVMLTSLGSRGDAQTYADIGFVACLTKPVHHQEVRGVLSLALGAPSEEEPGVRPIVTRHTAREVLPTFQDRQARILLVEDNITNQKVALAILKNLGLKADIAVNGRQAVETVAASSYDLILMDLQMPEMSGLEATRLIRSNESATSGRRLPIIAMTARAMQGDRDECLAAGMDDYISKPVSPRSIAEVLARWLPPEPDPSPSPAGL